MPNDAEIAQLASSVRRGSIIAAAGCGKTEQIARALEFTNQRRLILTHTHAGVDALTRRMKKYCIPPDKYRIDTIAGWCLRFAASYPQRSGITSTIPASTEEWDNVYQAGARLLDSGAIDGVLLSSYSGCFVDEYQDCTQHQHQVIERIANLLPTCVFGDPLQAIFNFRNQQSVDWTNDVFPVFPCIGELLTPWRWKNARNDELAEWLRAARTGLQHHKHVDLRFLPKSVRWEGLPDESNLQQSLMIKHCREAAQEDKLGNLIVICDSTNENRRASLAKKLAKQGFSTIESVSCKTLHSAAKAIDEAPDATRWKLVLDFASKCMTGAEKTALEKAVDARQQGRRQGQAKFGALLPVIDAISSAGDELAMVTFLQDMRDRPDSYLYRRELFYAMRASLQTKALRKLTSLSDAVWEVQNKMRHVGRRLANRSIGSTLLVKGLEFDRAIILFSPSMTHKDWYVALTRATKSMRIISPREHFTTK